MEGRLRTRKWQDKNNQDRYMTEIVCAEMRMLDAKMISDSGDGKKTNDPESDMIPENSVDDSLDDIPF